MQGFYGLKASDVHDSVYASPPIACLACACFTQDMTSSNPQQSELEGWLEGVVHLLGYFCLNNRKHQEVLQWGPPPTVLVRLCNLPFR